MTRLIGWIALLCVPLFALALVAFRVQPPNTVPEDEIGRCATPCWQGIQPGITTKQVALNQLTALNGFKPITPVCFSPSLTPCELYHWVSPENIHAWMGIQTQRGVVISIETKTPAVTLGDALLALDRLHHSLYTFQAGHDSEALYLWLSFSEASISLSAQITCPNSLTAFLQSPVDTLTIQSPFPEPQHVPTNFAFLRRNFYNLCEA